MEEKLFTVEQANKLLPQLGRELEGLQETKRKFEREYRRLQMLRASGLQADERGDPFFEAEAMLEFLQLEARTQIQSIHMKGVLLKDIDIGLIDFPARMNEEEILLCWRLGEAEVSHYHGYNDGYRSRKRLDGLDGESLK